MAIGGFNGNGGDLTLAQFERYVRSGEVHYFIASTGGRRPGGCRRRRRDHELGREALHRADHRRRDRLRPVRGRFEHLSPAVEP